MPTNIVKPLQWWDYRRDDPQADGLLAYFALWEGAGSEADNLVGGDSSTLNGPTWVASDRGGALAYDGGGNTHLLLPQAIAAGLGGARAVTVSCLARRSILSSARDVLVDLTRNGTASKVFFEFQAADTIRLGGRSDGVDSFQSVVTTTTWADGKWHLLTGVFDIAGDDLLIYVDGVQQPTTGSPAFNSTTFDAAVGDRQTVGTAASFTNGFLGEMSTLGIWLRALPAAEIEEQSDKPFQIITPRSAVPLFVVGNPWYYYHQQQALIG